MPRTPRLTAAALAGLLLAAVPAAASPAAHAHRRAGACRRANTPAGAAPRAAINAAVVCLINRERRAHGLPALRRSARLARSAQGWTNAMVARGDYAHGTWLARIDAVGVHPVAAGENIATGFRTPRQVVAAWMHSPPHCRNILAPDFTSVGAGSAAGTRRHPSAWTTDFATPRGTARTSRNWRPADTVC